ncbi:helix-turn-helix domain-containing protein [Carboxylicivirga sp. A043]|uniref:helix-turn-helix domain-containing protein n=1 Tax=Carboxylicivirga litoralis TaxID=2816963 RepID=UPI0021CB81B9|nr:helix-turn-helix domain-containing protein [Carboxylicivirga sp. A043]MCU4155235.1 helix-turn-helix domain-containing protein [Carboxylicivirga sp. A043]
MQEVLLLVKTIRSDIQTLQTKLDKFVKTHSQQLKEEWITKEEVMSILNISPRKLQTMRDNGTLPFSQIDGKMYYRASDVENLLKHNYSRR